MLHTYPYNYYILHCTSATYFPLQLQLTNLQLLHTTSYNCYVLQLKLLHNSTYNDCTLHLTTATTHLTTATYFVTRYTSSDNCSILHLTTWETSQ